MQRKYIYILVVILTIALVTISQIFEDKYLKEEVNVATEAIKEEEYKSVEVSSPLVIKNFQNDEQNITYHYKITISDAVGAYRYIYNSKESYLVFNALGEANIYIKSNETITIYDLPNEATYKIEQLTDVSEYYTTSINNIESKVATGTLSLENNIEFDNETIIVTTKPDKETSNNVTDDKSDKENNNKNENKDEEKEEIIVDKNPITSDLSNLAIICFIFATVVFISIKKLRIRRFE